jgi:hypothetical protein
MISRSRTRIAFRCCSTEFKSLHVRQRSHRRAFSVSTPTILATMVRRPTFLPRPHLGHRTTTDGAIYFDSLSISRLMYHADFFRSSIGSSDFRPARQMYFTALPALKVMCSVIVMHSTPDGCAV